MKHYADRNFGIVLVAFSVLPVLAARNTRGFIEKCTDFGQCSQICENVGESFKCKCLDGFEVGKETNSSCVVKDQQWKLIFTTKKEISFIDYGHGSSGRQTKHRISTKEGLPTGVTYDARRNHVYWTDVSSNSEAIYRGSVSSDSEIEAVVDTGLILPEGIAYDWISGNIYFADSDLSHIAVCGNASNLCSILFQENVDKPRSIALDPNIGIMFWTDWGSTPAIMQAGMDGSRAMAIVTTELKWPNGITVDHGNRRIYWVDARLDKIESSLFSGKDRRTILHVVASHPFGIDILGDRVYWSDWNTWDIKSVDKFTGHSILVHMHDPENPVLNGIALFHVGNQPIKRSNPCWRNPCSHICTLSPWTGIDTNGYKCFCPVGMILNPDEKTCAEPDDTPKLAIAFKNTIKLIRFNSIGRDVADSITLPSVKTINAIVYDPINHTLIFSDSSAKKVYQFSFEGRKLSVLIDTHLESVAALDFDPIGENLYWADEVMGTIEVMSLRTRARTKIMTRVNHTHEILTGDQIYDILVVPQLQSLFVAQMGIKSGKIHRMHLDGKDNQLFQRLGNKEPIALAYDDELKRVIWADKMHHAIEIISADGKATSVLTSKLSGPPSDVVKFGNQFYWTDMFSHKLTTVVIGTSSTRVINMGHFGDKSNFSTTYHFIMAKMAIISRDIASLDELRSKHECSTKEGKKAACSHICLLTGEGFKGKCQCPEGMVLDKDGINCKKLTVCDVDEFACSDGECIMKWEICDGISDCSHNEDEANCSGTKCSEDRFKCESNGACIYSHWVCDGESDCADGEDETNCTLCNKDEFRCESTNHCIPKSWHCDGASDCPEDNSDEKGCMYTCPAGFLQCKSTLNCILQDWVCDGESDCEDGSDEAKCAPKKSCTHHEFMCNDGKCIDKKLVCDNFAQCAEGEDEKHCIATEEPRLNDSHVNSSDEFSVMCKNHSFPVFAPEKADPESGTAAMVIMVTELMIIIILVGIVLGLLLKKRSVQHKIRQWSKVLQEPTRRLFTNERGQQNLDNEESIHVDVFTDGAATYVNAASVVYETGDCNDLEQNSAEDMMANVDDVSCNLDHSECHRDEEGSLQEEFEDRGHHHVDYSLKEKLIKHQEQ